MLEIGLHPSLLFTISPVFNPKIRILQSNSILAVFAFLEKLVREQKRKVY